MNSSKTLPTTLRTCAGICCSDCGYYIDNNTSWLNCEQRNKLISEQCNKEEKSRRELLNRKGKLGV